MAGVTINGFVTKDSDTIREELELSYKAVFGEDIDVSASSVFGQLIGLQTQSLVNIWELAQQEYSCNDIDAAEGVCLDKLVALNGFLREPATKSGAILTCFGTVGTQLVAGDLVRQSLTQEEFFINASATLQASNCYSVTIEVIDASGGSADIVVFTDTINEPVTGTGGTVNDIAADLASEINGNATLNTFLTATPTAAVVDIRQTTYSASNLFGVNLLDAFTQYNQVSNNYNVSAVNFGSIAVAENSINEIVTSKAGWDSVNNFEAGNVGVEAETDEELRARYVRFIGAGGNATEDAIAAKLILLDEVSNAIVESNRSDNTDPVTGRPPHSFEAIVITTETYDPPTSIPDAVRDTIGQRIWDTQPAGIQSFSSNSPPIEADVVDRDGNPQTVFFTLPIGVEIFVEVDFSVDEEKATPSIGIAEREQAVRDAITAFGNATYTLDEDVYATQLYTAVNSIEEVGEISRLVIGLAISPTGTFIPIADNEAAKFDSNRIVATQTNTTP